MSEDNKFAQKIRELREARGLSQEKLAELIRVSVMTVRRWEWDQRLPRLEEIKQLASVLAVTVDELLGSDSQKWELRMVVNKTEGGTIDMTGTGSTATLSVGDTAMAITLSANYPLWEDDEQFEELVEDLRRKRQLGLKTRKEGW
ncbi:MAG: helix-turn-helix transcriptional regulator [Synergistaceae bacterium]|nr:helix-turn-helix transcriptional regulator [Synergistaceae bacterium]